jgi:putative transcription factor
MQCELCGRVCACKSASIENVRMMLCPDCLKHHGTEVKEDYEQSSPIQSPFLGRIRKPTEKDVYKDMNKELVSGWNDIIKKAREKKGLSREELGFKIGERTVTIGKIENGDLRPSDTVVIRLEKELGITLVEEVKTVSNVSAGSRSGGGFTIGDFIKKK